MTGKLYAKFLSEVAIPEIKKVVGNLDDWIFQDDQDGKQTTKVATDVVDEFFIQRIEPKVGDAKFADVWPIENIWGILREKLRGRSFKSIDSVIRAVNVEWKKISKET